MRPAPVKYTTAAKFPWPVDYPSIPTWLPVPADQPSMPPTPTPTPEPPKSLVAVQPSTVPLMDIMGTAQGTEAKPYLLAHFASRSLKL
jgi:hypothetical protein